VRCEAADRLSRLSDNDAAVEIRCDDNEAGIGECVGE
jgi:hypothetical protein